VWKVITSFVMSVYLYIYTKQLGSHCMDFHEILYLNIFLKSVQKIKSSIEIWQE
jgi:hypothetical protein